MYAWITLAIVLAVIALLIALTALGAALSAHQRIAHISRPGKAVRQDSANIQTQRFSPTKRDSERRRPWVIYNPIKVNDIDEFRELLTQRALATGYLEPKFVETEADSPGTLQAITAASTDADLVIAAGGDGTQRAVAAGLAYTGIPIGIIPVGTGNLLARNLDIPANSIEDAVEIALTGANFTVDLGWMGIKPSQSHPVPDSCQSEGAQVLQGLSEQGESEALKRLRHTMPPVKDNEYAFLVMSGVGFDADMMASTNPDLKKSIGWFAYVVSGIKKHRVPQLRATIRMGDDITDTSVKARTILLANCGQLPGNVALLPDAAPGDGWIDVAILDTRGGILGWLELGWRVIIQGFGVRRAVPSLSSTLKIRKARRIKIELHNQRHAQVDGDVIAETTAVTARLDRRALIYRIP